MIAAITLARLCVGLGFVALVRRQGSAHIGGLLELPCLSRRTYRLSVPVSISSRLDIMLSSVENQKRTGFQNLARRFELNGTWRI
jgi:hypothetical protein